MLGKRIKELRTAKKLTQEELGKRINVTKVSISGYENGNRNPDTETLQKIADEFETTTDYLLGRTNDRRASNQLKIDLDTLDLTFASQSDVEFQTLYFKYREYLKDKDEYELSFEQFKLLYDQDNQENLSVANKEIKLTNEEIIFLKEIKKHPVLFHDLTSDPEKKIKELIKLYKMKKMFLDEDDEEYGDGFGDIED